MLKKRILLILSLLNLHSMEHPHKVKKTHSRSNSTGSQEFVTINILPDKKDSQEIKNDAAERRNQLKIAAIAAASAIIAAGLTAAVTLTVHFTEKCDPKDS